MYGELHLTLWQHSTLDLSVASKQTGQSYCFNQHFFILTIQIYFNCLIKLIFFKSVLPMTVIVKRSPLSLS